VKPLNVGLLGFGTVGRGTWDVLRRNEEEIARRAGRPIRVNWIATRTLDRARDGTRGVTGVNLTNDPAVVVGHPDVDIVCELIGGTGVALTLVLDAIANGKHVVTANKALLALHGNEIFAAASAKGVMVAFEAAVAGGVPIIKALREGLTRNRIEWIAGIINGTSNFILSEMRATGRSFADVLAEAQKRGMPRPTRRSTSRASTPRTSSPSCRPLRSACRCNSTARNRGHQQSVAPGHPYAEELGYRIKLLRHHAPREGERTRRHRASRAPDARAEQAADRERRGRDERRAGEGRRRRRDACITAQARAPSRRRAR
jgi:homoserine dehydrogenase